MQYYSTMYDMLTFDKGKGFCINKNKKNYPISSNSHPPATANKAIDSLKEGEGVYIRSILTNVSKYAAQHIILRCHNRTAMLWIGRLNGIGTITDVCDRFIFAPSHFQWHLLSKYLDLIMHVYKNTYINAFGFFILNNNVYAIYFKYMHSLFVMTGWWPQLISSGQINFPTTICQLISEYVLLPKLHTLFILK